MKQTFEYVRNQCGIRIKKCCASCAMKGLNSTSKRFCILIHEKVDSTDLCEQWKMHEGLMNTGRRRGVVRDIITKEVIHL